MRQGITANEVMRDEKERRRHIMDIAYSTRCLVIQANKCVRYSYIHTGLRNQTVAFTFNTGVFH